MHTDKEIILASASPRRIEMLKGAGLSLEIIPCPLPETGEFPTPPEEAMGKASQKAAYVRTLRQDKIIIGADTIVVSPNGEIFGKPADENDAMRMLKDLSGKAHSVITGVSIINVSGDETLFAVETKVFFRNCTDSELVDYINTGEPMDKAGAYGIQGYGGKLIDHFEGDYNNVVGLPLDEVLKNINYQEI